MVTFCEEHRRYFLSSRYLTPTLNNPTCCQTFFDWANPIFTTVGTCYQTNATVTEAYASIFSSFKLWVDARDDITPSEYQNSYEYYLKNE